MAIENAYEKISLEEELKEAESVSVDFDELEKNLQDEIDRELLDADLLVKDREIVENPNVLGESIKAVIWDQFLNQVGVNAGDTFISENNGQKLDLSKDAHIQTAENFASGKIATHNTHIDYQQRYDDWQANFERDVYEVILVAEDDEMEIERAIFDVDAYTGQVIGGRQMGD